MRNVRGMMWALDSLTLCTPARFDHDPLLPKQPAPESDRVAR